MENEDRTAHFSEEQFRSIQQFEADYNRADHYLRKALGRDRHVGFMVLVREYAQLHSGWRDADLFGSVAALRNALVHTKVDPYRYVAVPAEFLVRQLHEGVERLVHPHRVIPTFQSRVEIVDRDTSLAKVLRRIHRLDYSQFPVYGDGRFVGLLTENGITRWLAAHVSSRISLVELAEVTVDEVLASEEQRVNWQFISRTERVEDALRLFNERPLLEALLITQTGKESERLLGIVTQWDVKAGISGL